MLKLTRKVKSMQMFHQAIESATQGDRLGICVTQFESKLLERGLVCTPGSLPIAYGMIVHVEKVAYFKQSIKNNTKYHITLGHETVMAKVHLFQSSQNELDFDLEHQHVDEIVETKYYYAGIYLKEFKVLTCSIVRPCAVFFLFSFVEMASILPCWSWTILSP